MKSLILVFVVSAGTAGAQSYVTPPSVQPALNMTAGPFIVAGGTAAPGPATNLTGLGLAKTFVIGPLGYAAQINASGTNSATTTNMSIVFEHSFDMENWATNSTITWVIPPSGVAYGPIATNFTVTYPTGAIGNCALGRVRSLHHSNLASVYISNLVISTRLPPLKRGK